MSISLKTREPLKRTLGIPYIASLSPREDDRQRVVVVRSIGGLAGNGGGRRRSVVTVRGYISYWLERGGFGIERSAIGRGVGVNCNGRHVYLD